MYKLKQDLKAGTEMPEEFAKQFPELVEKKNKRWRAVKGKGYYYVDRPGRIGYKFDDYAPEDDWRYKTGNYFQTREQAEERVEMLEIEAELMELSDWESGEVYVLFLRSDGVVDWTSTTNFDGLRYGFEAEHSAATAAVKKIGEERIKKYLSYKFF